MQLVAATRDDADVQRPVPASGTCADGAGDSSPYERVLDLA